MHRLVVVDEEDKVIGIISLSDLLMYLVLRPTGECGGASLRNEHASIEEKDESTSDISPTAPADLPDTTEDILNHKDSFVEADTQSDTRQTNDNIESQDQ